ncbi:hypothetical protein pdam_00021830 [Pocillopora damicornis]|uniref:Uncharacterized protein n=1 Tax=Pocillopora damicornis TaxID=46731 RepID=A0A3M6UZ65_POCDA|nr:hypothetical protein pdam_00021830 [Pocillopora damicornis]
MLNKPWGAAVNERDEIAVTDTGNHRVQGEYLSQFGGKGNLDHQLDYPHGLSVDNIDNIIVADRNTTRDATGSLRSGDILPLRLSDPRENLNRHRATERRRIFAMITHVSTLVYHPGPFIVLCYVPTTDHFKSINERKIAGITAQMLLNP